MNPLQLVIPPPPPGQLVNHVVDPRSRPVVVRWGSSTQLPAVAEQFRERHAGQMGQGEPVFGVEVGLFLAASELNDKRCASALYDQRPPSHSLGTTAYFPNVAWPDQQVNIAVEYPGFDRYFDEEEREPRLRWATFQHNYRVAVHLIPPLLEPFVETYPLPGLDTHLTSFSPVGLVLAIVQSLPPFSEFHNNIAASAHMLFLRDLRIAMFVLKQRYVEHFGRRGSEYLMDVARGVVRHIDVFSLTAWRVWAGEKAALIAGYLDMRAVASFAAAVERQDWDPEKEKPDQQQIAAEYWIGWRMANAFLVVCIYQSSPKGY